MHPQSVGSGKIMQKIRVGAVVAESYPKKTTTLVRGYRQVVRHSTLTAVFVGSNPASLALLSMNFFIFFVLLLNMVWRKCNGLHAGYCGALGTQRMRVQIPWCQFWLFGQQGILLLYELCFEVGAI